MSSGGLEYAREVLEKALGPDKAIAIINRLTSSLQIRPFDFARKTDPSQLLNFIQNEHPQTIALIMSYLQPEQAGAILSGLPPDRQIDVARRIATMDRTSPEVIRDVERIRPALRAIALQRSACDNGLTGVGDLVSRGAISRDPYTSDAPSMGSHCYRMGNDSPRHRSARIRVRELRARDRAD